MADGNRNAQWCVGGDIGYGNLKFLACRLDTAETRTVILPVGAAPIARAAKTLSGKVDAGDGAVVMLGEEEWVAGVNPLSLQDFSRPTHSNYPRTKEYQALYYAALAKLGISDIAALVTGLPVDQFFEGKQNGLTAEISRRLSGEHYLSPSPGGGMNRSKVGRVLVVPQPAGAYTDLLQQEPSVAEDPDRFTLVLDVGFYSADWVLIQNGRVWDKSSGSSTSATSRILEEAAKLISSEHKDLPVSPSRVESAFRAGRPALLVGDLSIDYQAFLASAANQVAEDVLAKVATSLRGQSDLVDTVMLTGGGGSLFRPAIAKAFNRSRVRVSADPVVANARGFMLMAKSLVATR